MPVSSTGPSGANIHLCRFGKARIFVDGIELHAKRYTLLQQVHILHVCQNDRLLSMQHCEHVWENTLLKELEFLLRGAPWALQSSPYADLLGWGQI